MATHSELELGLRPAKFKVADRVMTKATGLPTCGTVIATFFAKYYFALFKLDPQKFSRWDNLYKDWYEKSVYVVEFDEPQATLSWEEYKEAWIDTGTEFKEEIARWNYSKYPKQIVALYPEDDLELF